MRLVLPPCIELHQKPPGIVHRFDELLVEPLDHPEIAVGILDREQHVRFIGFAQSGRRAEHVHALPGPHQREPLPPVRTQCPRGFVVEFQHPLLLFQRPARLIGGHLETRQVRIQYDQLPQRVPVRLPRLRRIGVVDVHAVGPHELVAVQIELEPPRRSMVEHILHRLPQFHVRLMPPAPRQQFRKRVLLKEQITRKAQLRRHIHIPLDLRHLFVQREFVVLLVIPQVPMVDHLQLLKSLGIRRNRLALRRLCRR